VAASHPLLRALRGPDDGPATWRISRWLLLRTLGVIFVFVFLTLYAQGPGLIGPQGIEPAGSFLSMLRERHGAGALYQAPTLFWLGSGDVFVRGVCVLGLAAAVGLILNLAPKLCALVAWLSYLSFSAAEDCSRIPLFFNFPPDHSALELAFLSIFLAPAALRPGAGAAAPTVPRWLLYLLLFRLMFGSGIAKILGGQPVWRDLSAIGIDYETRPHPAWTSHFLHSFPGWFHALSSGLTLLLEVVVPFFYFVPGRLRRFAGVSTILFMAAIQATGNYRWFNVVTIAVALPLLDDAALRRWLPRAFTRRFDGPAPPPRFAALRRAAFAPLAALLLVVGGSITLDGLWFPAGGPDLGLRQRLWQFPFRLVNKYALFGIIPTERRVLVIEGSQDGREWRPYEFHSNPGRLDKAPRHFAPFHHFLDFLVWFTAHTPVELMSHWFPTFLQRLLEGSRPVERLFEQVPFPDRPPRLIRVGVWVYRFSRSEERRRGVWWDRTYIGPYCPVVTLKDGKVVTADS
jgi:hypothetical protein